MKKLSAWRWLLAFGLLAGFTGAAFAQSGFSDQDALSDRLRQLDRTYGNYTELTSLAKSPGGNDIWLLTIGTGDVSSKPAIAVIGGAQGSHILGTELAVKFAEQLLAGSGTDSIKTLLESTTFYVMPSVNPDAAQQYFASLKYERNGNGTSTDDDRDGSFDEDGFDDLNGDGLITMIRVADPTGKWMVSSEDDRVMVEADASKGEKGSYLLFTEGRDNDNDGDFNEDGEGGVNINQNFTFDHPYFQPGSSENMADQNETRAVLDFLYETARNTFAVVSFGPENNLSSALRFNRGGISKRVIDGWYEDDVAINELVSGWYNKLTGSKGAPNGAAQQGDLFQWAYFHFGRYSFSTPGWWVPEVKDEDGKAKKFSNNDAHLLAWAESQEMNAFVDWTVINHPDFPGKTVEVGGIKPFAALPPYFQVDSIATGHTAFIVKLASEKPMLELVNLTVENAGRNLTRISVDLHNTGLIPTASHVGTRTDWVRNVLIDLELSGNLALVSGNKRSYEETINGDGSVSYTWLVRGTGRFTIKAGAPQSGFSTIQQTIN